MPEYPETKRVPCRCGGKALLGIFESTEITGGRVYIVICDDCKIRTDYYPEAEEAVKAWNRAMGAKDINVPANERTVEVELISNVWNEDFIQKGMLVIFLGSIKVLLQVLGYTKVNAVDIMSSVSGILTNYS
ncbi:MAG: Lar family restriction alleviation protein [Flexilinea sp.]|nr:Lar family restriction alleviation protein [Flexilinea sp.]